MTLFVLRWLATILCNPYMSQEFNTQSVSLHTYLQRIHEVTQGVDLIAGTPIETVRQMCAKSTMLNWMKIDTLEVTLAQNETSLHVFSDSTLSLGKGEANVQRRLKDDVGKNLPAYKDVHWHVQNGATFSTLWRMIRDALGNQRPEDITDHVILVSSLNDIVTANNKIQPLSAADKEAKDKLFLWASKVPHVLWVGPGKASNWSLPAEFDEKAEALVQEWIEVTHANVYRAHALYEKLEKRDHFHFNASWSNLIRRR